MIKLSIIIPVYKVEKYIKRCLESVFTQNVSDNVYEVIVVDDGTPDNSMLIVEEFASEHSNLRIVHQSNLGLSAARNIGLEISKGEYVWFVDSDDWIEKNSLNELIDLLDINHVDVFAMPLKSINESTSEILLDSLLSKDIMCDFCSGLDFIKYAKHLTPIQLYIFSRSFLKSYELKFMNNVYHEDLEFAPKMLYFASQVFFLSKSYYNYLIRITGSITSDFSMKRSEDLIIIIKSYNSFFKKYKLKYKEKRILNRNKIGCLYTLLFNLNKSKDFNAINNFIIMHYWFLKRLSIESIFTLKPKLSFYGILFLVNYKLLFRFLNR